MPNIKLKTSDNEIFEIDVNIAKWLGTIKTALENSLTDENYNFSIPLPNVNSLILSKILQWINHHKDEYESFHNSTGIVISSWDENFLKVDRTNLYELINAVDYLDIKGLLYVIRKHLGKMIRHTNVHEILNIHDCSELSMLHHYLNICNLECYCSMQESLSWGENEPWGIVTGELLHRSCVNEVYGTKFDDILSRFPKLIPIEKSLNWEIDNVNRSLQISDNKTNAIYTKRVLELCIQKYLRTIPDHTIPASDTYTEILLRDRFLPGPLFTAFEDHYKSFKYKYTPYNFSSSIFLALSYLLQKEIIDNIENYIENLPKINEIVLAAVLQNIEQYLFPFRKLRHIELITLESLLVRVEVEDNSGHYLIIAFSSDENEFSTLKYEILLYILSTPDFKCNSINIYYPIVGKKYFTKCNLN